MEHSFEHDSWIKHVSYDDESMYLTVNTERDAFEMANVPLETYKEFEKAPSKGNYFNRHLKGKYSAEFFTA